MQNTGVSIIVPCDGSRYELFKTTYATYMCHGIPFGLEVEFIMVSRTIQSCNLPLVRVVNYQHVGKYFNPAKALNLGVANSRYSNVFITCPEVKPVTNILEQFNKLGPGNYICRAYDQSDSGTISDLVCHGLKDHIPSMYFLGIFRKDDLLKINGWDEEFMVGSCWEDIDFGERFTRAELSFQVREEMKVLHMYHPRNYNTPGWDLNWAVLQSNIAANLVRCKNGILKE